MEYDQIADIYDSCVATTLDVPFFLDAAGQDERRDSRADVRDRRGGRRPMPAGVSPGVIYELHLLQRLI